LFSTPCLNSKTDISIILEQGKLQKGYMSTALYYRSAYRGFTHTSAANQGYKSVCGGFTHTSAANQGYKSVCGGFTHTSAANQGYKSVVDSLIHQLPTKDISLFVVDSLIHQLPTKAMDQIFPIISLSKDKASTHPHELHCQKPLAQCGLSG
jgi:hypothetical protein